MKTVSERDFTKTIDSLTFYLAAAPVVQVGEWQGQIDAEDPKSQTVEVEDVSIEYQIPPTLAQLQEEVEPNLPWAEEHFSERISGIAHNPPPSHVRWPFAQRDNSDHRDGGTFSHTYPERFWPKNAGLNTGAPVGIRYKWGDLGDVIELLTKRPGTRQAFLPVWFPEDTGAVHGERVPCTIGYHFLLRNGRLKVVYYIRSCDFLRHFRDDVYMACRLTQYISRYVSAQPGRIVMHISSLHIFAAEQELMKQRAQEWQMSRLHRL